MIRRLWKCLGILALIGFFCGCGVMALVAVASGRRRTTRPADCMIVLGCRVRSDATLSASLLYRLEAALEGYKSGLAPLLLLSGGRGKDEPVAEAHAMRDWLLQSGIPQQALVVEARSSNTRENLSFSREIMRKRGLERAIVVTNNFHLERALWICRDLGMDVTGFPAREPLGPKAYFYNHFHESGSWVLYYLKKWF